LPYHFHINLLHVVNTLVACFVLLLHVKRTQFTEFNQRSHTLRTVSGYVGYPDQLSLAIPPWLGAMSTSESWGVYRHTARCTSPVSVLAVS